MQTASVAPRLDDIPNIDRESIMARVPANGCHLLTMAAETSWGADPNATEYLSVIQGIIL